MTNWAATVAAALSLVLVVVNTVMLSNNQANRLAVTERQQLIDQSGYLERIEHAMVRSAVAANNPKDAAYTRLLARYHIGENTAGAISGAKR